MMRAYLYEVERHYPVTRSYYLLYRRRRCG